MTDNPYADTTVYQPGQAAAQYPYAGQPPAASDRQWPLAGWGSRVAASLIDSLLSCIGLLVSLVGVGLLVAGSPSSTSTDPTTGALTTSGGDSSLVGMGILLMVVGYLIAFAIQIWNRWVKQGRTGQSVGKKVMNLYLVDERTGNPIGAGMAFVRDLAHFLDGLFYIGYLWPLWDAKKQTFADKLVGTVVAKAPQR